MAGGARIIITRVFEPDEIGRQILPHMEALGAAIAARAQRIVPKRTWALHDTISAEASHMNGRVTATVGAGGGDVDYALYVEKGTSKMAAQPYLRPALAQSTSGDLNYGGTGAGRHGVTSRRARARGRLG